MPLCGKLILASVIMLVTGYVGEAIYTTGTDLLYGLFFSGGRLFSTVVYEIWFVVLKIDELLVGLY